MWWKMYIGTIWLMMMINDVNRMTGCLVNSFIVWILMFRYEANAETFVIGWGFAVPGTWTPQCGKERDDAIEYASLHLNAAFL